MSTIDNINESGMRVYETITTRTPNNDLGEDAFMQILVAQMSNQDPLEPTSDTEFIAQMAQFSSLEQMQNMNENMKSMMTYDYMGKNVAAAQGVDGDGNAYTQAIMGQVVGISKIGGVEYLQVLDITTESIVTVAPDQVTQVAPDQTIENLLAGILTEMGKIATNTAPPATGEEGEEEEGVDGVEGTDGADDSTDADNTGGDDTSAETV